MRECFLTTWSCPGGGKGTRDSLAENSFIISSKSACLAGRRCTRRLTRRRRMGDTGRVNFSSDHIKQQSTSLYHLREMITMINSPSERCSREIWRWYTQQRARRGGTLNSTCGRSGRHLPDRTNRADSQWEMTPLSHMTCFCFCESWCLYLYSPVVLYDNAVGSVPKKVSENQEVITLFSLLTGQLKTT